MSTPLDDTRPMTTAEIWRLIGQMLDDDEWEWERLRLMAMERDRKAMVTIGFRIAR